MLRPPSLELSNDNQQPSYPDLKDIKGQESAKRALEVAASGGHNILMIGPPGSGKSMLASRLPGIMPKLDAKEMLDVSMIASVSNNLTDGVVIKHRPYRDPHHNCSMAAMIGGGRKAAPGEVSLAHNGVLFLDELPEFPRSVLDSLRQPLETGQVSVARAQAHVTYPADFQLVAAMNPCRCGYLGDQSRSCNKAPRCGVGYQSKISGPLFDRIDIHIEVPAVTPMAIRDAKEGESSATIAKRVAHTRQIQAQRYASFEQVRTNAHADGDVLERYATPDNAGKQMLDSAFEKMGLTMRGYNRVLRVARTIADMEQSQHVHKHHIAEALSYRQITIKNG